MTATHSPEAALFINQVQFKPLFDAGKVYATPGATALLEEVGLKAYELLIRHVHGDDGEVDPEDHAANQAAMIHGTRLLSAYEVSAGLRIWIITEADRSATTLLLPEEY